MNRSPHIANFLAGVVAGTALTSLAIATAQDRGERGTQPPCTADIAPAGGDNVVNVEDLLAVINQWGPCPCVGGCDDGNPCTNDACVDGACVHTPVTTGCCANPCGPVPHATSVACINGQCVITGCQFGWLNCDGVYANGCETPGFQCP